MDTPLDACIFLFSSLVCFSFNVFFLGGEGEVEGRGGFSVLVCRFSFLVFSSRFPSPSLFLSFFLPLSLSPPIPIPLSLSGSLAIPLAYFLLPGRVCLCARTAVLLALSCLCLPAYVCALVSWPRLLSRVHRLPLIVISPAFRCRRTRRNQNQVRQSRRAHRREAPDPPAVGATGFQASKGGGVRQ